MPRGGQPGNQNAAKAKHWRQAIDRVCAQKGGTVEQGLDQIAEKLYQAAMAGESWAILEIGNRKDGKPVQPVAGDDESDPIRHVVDGCITLKRP